ncbi:hypothetical protein ASG36_07295 [Geodermatophilus sp. Leaf369]|nr:hypothetical protein ASG36_07295 [Geodermatophilus sp. Leaf369]
MPSSARRFSGTTTPRSAERSVISVSTAASGWTTAESSPARSSGSCRAAPTRLAAARSSRSSGRVQGPSSSVRSPRTEPESSGVRTSWKPVTACRASAAIVGQRR